MARTTWRKVAICDCMTAPLDELAKTSGRDILVSPIPGFGSFQQGATASAGTGSGGGHIDVYLTQLNQEQKLRLEGLARQIGFYADIRDKKWWSPTRRKWLQANWANHLHLVLKSCTHLSPEAKSQLQDWYAGGNGLVGNDPDDGDRRFLRQTWPQYLARKSGPAKPETGLTRPTIDLANLKFGKTNGDVKRYQAAVWKALAPATRTAILARHHLKESQITDAFYGKVTREMTTALYTAIAAKEPRGGWPRKWVEPGPRLLQRLGFIVRNSTKDLGNSRDEFAEPLTGPDETGETADLDAELQFEGH